jgi:hypothetical protein
MTLKRVSFLQELLRFVGLGERLHLEWLSSAEAQKFVRVVTALTDKIRMLGPSPLALFHQTFRSMIPGPGSGFAVETETEGAAPGVGGAERAEWGQGSAQ